MYYYLIYKTRSGKTHWHALGQMERNSADKLFQLVLWNKSLRPLYPHEFDGDLPEIRWVALVQVLKDQDLIAMTNPMTSR